MIITKSEQILRESLFAELSWQFSFFCSATTQNKQVFSRVTNIAIMQTGSLSWADIQGGSKKVSCCTVSTAYFFEPPCRLLWHIRGFMFMHYINLRLHFVITGWGGGRKQGKGCVNHGVNWNVRTAISFSCSDCFGGMRRKRSAFSIWRAKHRIIE